MLDDTNVYYMDVNRDNAIVHVNINNPNPIVLTEANIEHYNVYGSLIFYQRGGDNPALCVVKMTAPALKSLLRVSFAT